MQKIVPLGMVSTYLESRKIVSGYGMKLPSNALLDEFAHPEKGGDCRFAFPLWARELLAYPEKDGVFGSGDFGGSGIVLPAKYIDKEVSSSKYVGLFLDPAEFEEFKSRTVVHPARITVLSPFIQESGRPGLVDESTRVPLDLFCRQSNRRRSLYRLECGGICPIIRDSRLSGFGWRDIIASTGFRGSSGVAAQIEPVRLPIGLPEIIPQAMEELAEVLESIPPQKVAALSRLVSALEQGQGKSGITEVGFCAGFEPINGC